MGFFSCEPKQPKVDKPSFWTTIDETNPGGVLRSRTLAREVPTGVIMIYIRFGNYNETADCPSMVFVPGATIADLKGFDK